MNKLPRLTCVENRTTELWLAINVAKKYVANVEEIHAHFSWAELFEVPDACRIDPGISQGLNATDREAGRGFLGTSGQPVIQPY